MKTRQNESAQTDDIKTEPYLEILARIGWSIRYSNVIYAEPPYLVMQSIPSFPRCFDKLHETMIVWDVLSLIDSIKRPGSYELLTCQCGSGEHAGLRERVLVSHPDNGSVVWELDIPGFKMALDDSLFEITEGFIRLIFSRDEYELDIRNMVRELQRRGSAPVPVTAICDEFYKKTLFDSFELHHDSITVGEIQPDRHGMTLEKILELDADEPWEREPLWPQGTVIEFGFFRSDSGHELMIVDGICTLSTWPGSYFTRWCVHSAFERWMSFVKRVWSLGYFGLTASYSANANDFVLTNRQAEALCHEAGRRFAATMQDCLNEGETAPNVTVCYEETDLWSATKKNG